MFLSDIYAWGSLLLTNITVLSDRTQVPYTQLLFNVTEMSCRCQYVGWLWLAAKPPLQSLTPPPPVGWRRGRAKVTQIHELRYSQLNKWKKTNQPNKWCTGNHSPSPTSRLMLSLQAMTRQEQLLPSFLMSMMLFGTEYPFSQVRSGIPFPFPPGSCSLWAYLWDGGGRGLSKKQRRPHCSVGTV